MTRPASSLTPASYAHCWAGTRSSLLTCWLGVSQVGLVRIRTHPLGNNNQFHEITLNSKASGLPWREHALVGPERPWSFSREMPPRRAHAIPAVTSWHRERYATVWRRLLPLPDEPLPPSTPQALTVCPPQCLAAVTTCRSAGGYLTQRASAPRCRRLRGSPARGPPGPFPPGPVLPVVGFLVPSSGRRWEHGSPRPALLTGRR